MLLVMTTLVKFNDSGSTETDHLNCINAIWFSKAEWIPAYVTASNKLA